MFILKMVYCVFSLESPRLGDSSENTQHTCTFMLKKIGRYPYYAFRPGAMINIHLLELPQSRIYLHGSNGVQAIEVLL